MKLQITGNRALRILLRTVHIACFSVLAGGHWFNAPRAGLQPWLLWAGLSGAALLALELRGGAEWFLQLAGALTVVKILVLALIPAFWEQRCALLAAAVVLGSVGSHLPSALRHFNLLRPAGPGD